MIFTIYITACLISNPTHCAHFETQARDLSTNPTIQYIQAQSIVANFMQWHPSYHLEKFRVLEGTGL